MSCPRTVFILDVSGSMVGDRLETLNLAVKRNIEDIPDGYYVGIVLFESTVWIHHEVVKITDRSVRDSLLAKCPNRVYGATDCAGGLKMGLTALRNVGLSTEGATFLFVTDGGDNCSGRHYGPGLNYVDKILPDLLAAKVRVVCIAVKHSADPNLERLAEETKGNTYAITDNNREMAVRVYESAFQEVKTSKEINESLRISVCEELFSLNKQTDIKNVIIDSELGRNTIFTVGSEDIDLFSLSILSPDGIKYDSTSNEFSKNQSLKRYQLKLKSAESGVWTISFIKHCNRTITTTISVTCQPFNPNAIQMRVVLKDPDIKSKTPPIIIAELIKGTDAVIGAQVVATINKPDGTQRDVKLNNYNNIYCNYFTDYCGSGRYNVCVLALNHTNNCQLKSITGNRLSLTSVSQFSRQRIVGCFKVETFMPSEPANDQTLKELSLSEKFNSLALNSITFDLPIEVPLSQTAKAIIKPSNLKRVAQKTDGIKSAKDKFFDLYLVTKKLIIFSSITEAEKNSLKTEIEEINACITSPKSISIEEIESYYKKLENIKAKRLLK